MKSELIITYFLIINIISSIITMLDKRRAIKNKWRIKERTLWLFGVLGGAPFTYITMKLTRHKTKHKSFMIGMPILIVIDIIFMIYLIVLYR